MEFPFKTRAFAPWTMLIEKALRSLPNPPILKGIPLEGGYYRWSFLSSTNSIRRNILFLSASLSKEEASLPFCCTHKQILPILRRLIGEWSIRKWIAFLVNDHHILWCGCVLGKVDPTRHTHTFLCLQFTIEINAEMILIVEWPREYSIRCQPSCTHLQMSKPTLVTIDGRLS